LLLCLGKSNTPECIEKGEVIIKNKKDPISEASQINVHKRVEVQRKSPFPIDNMNIIQN